MLFPIGLMFFLQSPAVGMETVSDLQSLVFLFTRLILCEPMREVAGRCARSRLKPARL